MSVLAARQGILRMGAKSKPSRIAISMSSEELCRLQAAMNEVGITSYKQVFGSGLSMLRWAMNERRQGRIVGSFDESTKRLKELSMDVLEKAAELGEKERASALRAHR